MGPEIELLIDSFPEPASPDEAGRLPPETALRPIAARMLCDARDVEEAVRKCFARTDALPQPQEDEKAFARRMFRIIIDAALRIERQQREWFSSGRP